MLHDEYAIMRQENEHDALLFNLYNKEVEEYFDEEQHTEEMEAMEEFYSVWNDDNNERIAYCDTLEQAIATAYELNEQHNVKSYNAYIEC